MELLVVISLLGLLVLLLLPAIQAAREAARMAQCRNNLHQMGVALHSFESSRKRYPSGVGFSYAAELLPYLEQNALYSAINFTQDATSTGDSNANLTVANIVINTFLCPSDASASGLPGPLSYPGNMGSMFIDEINKRRGDGIFGPGLPVSINEIPDGTSRTVVISEWLTGAGLRDPKWAVLRVEPYRDSLGVFAETCAGLDPQLAPLAIRTKGTPWLEGTPGLSLYNHVLTPNRHTCLNGHQIYRSGWTAESRHPSGAFVLFADGHVEFSRSAINPEVWRAIGSRDGREVVGSEL